MTEKRLDELSKNDKRVLMNTKLSWQGKFLSDCTKGELQDCILHLTSQVAYLNKKSDMLEDLIQEPFKVYFIALKQRIEKCLTSFNDYLKQNVLKHK